MNGRQNLTVIASGELQVLLAEFGIQPSAEAGVYDLSNLDRSQYVRVLNQFVENRNSKTSW